MKLTARLTYKKKTTYGTSAKSKELVDGPEWRMKVLPRVKKKHHYRTRLKAFAKFDIELILNVYALQNPALEGQRAKIRVDSLYLFHCQMVEFSLMI